MQYLILILIVLCLGSLIAIISSFINKKKKIIRIIIFVTSFLFILIYFLPFNLRLDIKQDYILDYIYISETNVLDDELLKQEFRGILNDLELSNEFFNVYTAEMKHVNYLYFTVYDENNVYIIMGHLSLDGDNIKSYIEYNNTRYKIHNYELINNFFLNVISAKN